MIPNIDYYRIPEEFFLRIHFVRPRFKSNIENVLLYMARECCKIPPLPCKDYNIAYTNAIKMFPGNQTATDKTLANWRTEIPALFGFYTEDKATNITHTSKMAEFLDEHQDLTQFMKFFLFTFQFPGGHLKAKDNIDLICNSVKFKPAKLILQVLQEGNVILSQEGKISEMSVNAEEVTYCIFNDLRATRGERSPKEIATIILSNRKKKLKYYNKYDKQIFSSKGVARTRGDVIRYAGDILDYMSLADILEMSHDYFRMKPNEKNTIDAFVNDNTFFNGYDKLYNHQIHSEDVDSIETHWFDYVNNSLNPNLFKTDISKIVNISPDLDIIYKERITALISNEERKTKDIGNIGEALIYGHEKMRLKIAGYELLLHRVQIVDSPAYHPGFDIDSLEGDGTNDHRYIEVKTTISKQKILLNSFHMSPNEWDVAGTNKEHYCIYRLMLSASEKILYILRDPVNLYKQDLIMASPRNGMEISYDIGNFERTELLTWQN